MKPKPGQRWQIEVDGHEYRYRPVKRRSDSTKFGEWQAIKNKKAKQWEVNIYWEVRPGKSSGMPLDLFKDLHKLVIRNATRLSLKRRTTEKLLRFFSRGIQDLATAIGGTVIRYNRRRFTVRNYDGKRLFAICIAHLDGSLDQFAKVNEWGKIMRNQRGRRKYDVAAIAEELRVTPKTKAADMEERSNALMRWAIVVFDDGIRFVPLKAG